MWSILENVPCALKTEVYSAAFGWKVLKMSICSIWFNVSVKVCVSYTFCIVIDVQSHGVVVGEDV